MKCRGNIRRAPRYFSRKLQADRERCRIAVGRRRRSQHELIATTPENPIILVSRGAPSFRGIGRVSVDAIRQSVVEIHLRREFEAPTGLRHRANLDVNVHRPTSYHPG